MVGLGAGFNHPPTAETVSKKKSTYAMLMGYLALIGMRSVPKRGSVGSAVNYQSGDG